MDFDLKLDTVGCRELEENGVDFLPSFLFGHGESYRESLLPDLWLPTGSLRQFLGVLPS